MRIISQAPKKERDYWLAVSVDVINHPRLVTYFYGCTANRP